MYFKKTRIAAGVSFNGPLLKSRKWRRQENPSYLSFFGKTKASKKKKTLPGAANVAAHAHVFFFQLAFVLHIKNLENSDVGASSRRWFLTGG